MNISKEQPSVEAASRAPPSLDARRSVHISSSPPKRKKSKKRNPDDYAHHRRKTNREAPDVVYDLHDSIGDRVSSPQWRNSVMKNMGHISMDVTAPHDPRQTHVRQTTSPDVGPGAHNLDPLHERTTAVASFQPGQSHRMIAYSKDPTRESPAFKSPPRGEDAPAILEVKRMHSHVDTMLPHDYKSWTSKGCYTSTQPRVIEAERWGPSCREPRPPAKELNQEVYELNVTNQGQPATCQQYAQDKTTPSYKVPFGSKLPRLSVLPASYKQDTRISARLHHEHSNTPADLGPGSYASDLPLYVSHHTAYEGKQVYYSLAASPASPSRRELEEAASGWSSPKSHKASPRKKPTTDDVRSRAISSVQAEVDANRHPHALAPAHYPHTHSQAHVHARVPHGHLYSHSSPLPSWPAAQQTSKPGESSKPGTPSSPTRPGIQSPIPLPLYAPSNSVMHIGSPNAYRAAGGPVCARHLSASGRLSTPPAGHHQLSVSGRLATPPLGQQPTSNCRLATQLGEGGYSGSRQHTSGLSEVVMRVSSGLGQLMNIEAEAQQVNGLAPLTVPSSQPCSLPSATAPGLSQQQHSGHQAGLHNAAMQSSSQQLTALTTQCGMSPRSKPPAPHSTVPTQETSNLFNTTDPNAAKDGVAGAKARAWQQERPDTREREAEAAYVEVSNADWLAHQAAISANYLATDFLRGTAGRELRLVVTQAQSRQSTDPPTLFSSAAPGQPMPYFSPQSTGQGFDQGLLQTTDLNSQQLQLASTAPAALQLPKLDSQANPPSQASPAGLSATQPVSSSHQQGQELPTRCHTPPFVRGGRNWVGTFAASPPLTTHQHFAVEEQGDPLLLNKSHKGQSWDGMEKAHCDQLCFLKRVEPQRTRLLTRLHVVADLLAARKLARSTG